MKSFLIYDQEMKFETVNPTNNTKLESYTYITPTELENILSEGHRAFKAWSNSHVELRQGKLKELAKSLENYRSQMARMMALEMGKPLAQAEGELKKCEATVKYYSEYDPRVLNFKSIESGFKMKSGYVPVPTGIIFGIMPWNFPVWQIIRFCIPTLLLGNTVVVKPSDQTAGTSLLLQKAFDEVFGENQVFKILLLENELAPKVVDDHRVRGVSFTGSTKTGKHIATLAATSLKKSVLELGGSDASVVLPDAHIQKSAEECAKSRMQNAGQSCVASKRFFVQRRQLDEFLEYFSYTMSNYKVGDPLVPGIEMGPLAQSKFKATFLEEWQRLKPYMAESKITHEGDIFSQGAYFAPRWAVMTEHSPKTTATEMFCPAAQIFPYDDEETVFDMVNSVPFGLGSSIYSGDSEKAWTLARNKMDAGMVTINEFVKSDPALPFGGVKQSGWGRELSPLGIFEFSNLKMIGEG